MYNDAINCLYFWQQRGMWISWLKKPAYTSLRARVFLCLIEVWLRSRCHEMKTFKSSLVYCFAFFTDVQVRFLKNHQQLLLSMILEYVISMLTFFFGRTFYV